MNKFKKILKTSSLLALVSVGAISLSGCKKDKNPDEEDNLSFSFSLSMQSGSNQLLVDKQDLCKVNDNGVDNSGRSYTFYSTDPTVASVDPTTGVVTGKKEGSAYIYATEAGGVSKQLSRPINVVKVNDLNDAESNGGYNFSGASDDASLKTRTQILGKLEKYAMDKHLTGITLFDNGGYIKYSNRVKLPGGKNAEYITGYGFGLLSEGEIEGTLPGEEGRTQFPTYYHGSIAQDSLKINQYNATGSQVSDLASYITSTYWGTKLDGTSAYKWYPVLATDRIEAPIVSGFDANKKPIIDGYKEKADNNEPVPMEPENDLGLYKKWRIYVKTDGDVNGSVLKYHTKSSVRSSFNNLGVKIEDYEFIYKLLLTQTSNLIRGTEMANDSSYGIKGAQAYYNATKNAKTKEAIDAEWNSRKDNGKLGISTGSDRNGAYIDLELINAIDSFTAMYTLSSSLVSPLPEAFFVGDKAIGSNMADSAKKYGSFNSGGDNAIIDYTLACGPYQLEQWLKKDSIVFSRNDDWFEVGENRYKIPGIYNRVIDSSTDTEKVWKQFIAGNLDVAGIPTTKVQDEVGKDLVYATKGDSTFKLNVNSCTQEQWEKMFGPKGTVAQNSTWNVKPWMSNSNFLDGLFFSIDRKAFASKRGVTPSINYFSDAYLSDPKNGTSYNTTPEHRAAVEGYETITNGVSDYGYNYDKAVDSFRNAVAELTSQHKLVLGTRENPTEISIHIRWMYPTDEKEYGEDIAYYFQRAFNDDAVCGGKVKLNVEQKGVTNWEDVYNMWMMKGQFDLGFGAISGNTYNPLNFMEVLKSDNSSQFTLNFGPDTSIVDPTSPIVFDGVEWSYDGLWEVADHGGIVEEGKKVKPVKLCRFNGNNGITKLDGAGREVNLYNGFNSQIKVDFAESSNSTHKAVFDFSRVDISINNKNITLTEDKSCYNKQTGIISFKVDAELAQEINDEIKERYGYDRLTDLKPDDFRNNPFVFGKYGEIFEFELYYTVSIDGGAPSENYVVVSLS